MKWGNLYFQTGRMNFAEIKEAVQFEGTDDKLISLLKPSLKCMFELVFLQIWLKMIKHIYKQTEISKQKSH